MVGLSFKYHVRTKKTPLAVSHPQGTEKGLLLKKWSPQEIITNAKAAMGVRSIVFLFRIRKQWEILRRMPAMVALPIQQETGTYLYVRWTSVNMKTACPHSYLDHKD